MSHLYSNILEILAAEMQAAGIPGVTAENLIVDEVVQLSEDYKPKEFPNTEIHYRTSDDSAQGMFRYSRVPASHAFLNGPAAAGQPFDADTPLADFLAMLSNSTGFHFDESDIGEWEIYTDDRDESQTFTFLISPQSLRYVGRNWIDFSEGGSGYTPMEAPAVLTTKVTYNRETRDSSYYPSYVMVDAEDYLTVDNGRVYIDATLLFEGRASDWDGWGVSVGVDLIGPDNRLMVIAQEHGSVDDTALLRSYRTEVPADWNVGAGGWKLRLAGRWTTALHLPYVEATPAERRTEPYDAPRGVRLMPGLDPEASVSTVRDLPTGATVNECVSQVMAADNNVPPINRWRLVAASTTNGNTTFVDPSEYSVTAYPTVVKHSVQSTYRNFSYIDLTDEVGLTAGKSLTFRTKTHYNPTGIPTVDFGIHGEVLRFFEEGKIYYEVRVAPAESSASYNYDEYLALPLLASGVAGNLNDPADTWHTHTVTMPVEMRESHYGCHRVIVFIYCPGQEVLYSQSESVPMGSIACFFDPSHQPT